MPSKSYPIVGSYYRPPAKTLLSILPIGTPLIVVAEPNNAVDENAVAVWLPVATMPTSARANLEIKSDELALDGFSVDDIFNESHWHLGYIPAQLAALLRADGVVPDEGELLGEFTCAPSGRPMVSFETPII